MEFVGWMVDMREFDIGIEFDLLMEFSARIWLFDVG